MNKLFFKFFLKISTIMLIAFSVIGSALVMFTVKYAIESKQQQLYDNAVRVANITATFIDNSNPLSQRSYTSTLNNYSQSIESDIYICNTYGEVLILSSYNNDATFSKTSMPSSIINTVNKNKLYVGYGKMDGFFTSTRYTVAVPFSGTYPDSKGFVLMSSYIKPFSTLFRDVMSLFITALIISLAITCIVIFFTTRSMVLPLRDMNNLVKKFSKGDFKARLAINGKDEIAELATSFNSMADSLASLEEMRSSFISNVSHELKTPMTTISGFIDGILDETIPDEKRNYYLSIVSQETKRLSRLVNSLLDIARIDSGSQKYNIEKIDLTNMLINIFDSFDLVFEEKNVLIFADFPPNSVYAYADYDALYRVVYNLAENASKFVDTDGKIELSLHYNDKLSYVSIKNTGFGISDADIPYLFDRFYKADKSRGLDKKGLGLGLYMAKQIIRSFGGDITARSQEGGFTEFEFSIPNQPKN